MTTREQILGRIREALKVRAEPPHTHDGGEIISNPASVAARKWLPLVGASEEERWAAFLKNANDLKVTVHLVKQLGEAAEILLSLKEAERWKKAGTHAGSLAQPLAVGLKLPMVTTDDGTSAEELESSDVGLTECDALVAQTGSVLLTSRSAGGRALSVLPPHHVVVARRSQLVPDLPSAFDLLKQRYASNYPSFISFITGPSRTGDIERILVLGAHGPKRLTILCLDDAA